VLDEHRSGRPGLTRASFKVIRGLSFGKFSAFVRTKDLLEESHDVAFRRALQG
jgi:hypothetical protein